MEWMMIVEEEAKESARPCVGPPEMNVARLILLVTARGHFRLVKNRRQDVQIEGNSREETFGHTVTACCRDRLVR